VATVTVKRVQVLDVPVDCIDQEQALKALEEFLSDRERHQLVFLNRRNLFRGRRDAEFRRCLREASLILPISPAVVRAAGFLRREPLTLFSPFAFVIQLLALAERLNKSVYLLGARKEELERAERNLRGSFPKLRLVGRYSGYFPKPEQRNVLLGIRKAAPAFLLVGDGLAARDLWILRHKKDLGPGVALWAGDCFDLFSGKNRSGRVAVDGAAGPWTLFPLLVFWLLALFHRIFKR
jgi:N-acetylglucosaminyldiphosphoundecaprenol N-acetyl-beta-D-mannosaminyltransferase